MSEPIQKALLVISNREISLPIKKKLEEAGWKVALAENTASLKESLTKTRDYAAVLVDLRLSSDDAIKIMSYIRKIIPKDSRLVLADQFVDELALERLEKAKFAIRLGADAKNVDAVFSRLTKPLPSGGPKYDVNVINCFVSSVNNVFEYYVGEKPEHSKATIAPANKVPTGFVTSIVTFDGDVSKGTAALTCDHAFIVSIASRVNGASKVELENDREAVIATVEELTDQIFGKAELLLNGIGYNFKVSAPEIHYNENKDLSLASEAPVMIIPFTMKRMKFYIGFSILQ
jgi:CheY-specific phosphatase CheX/CheY-like chemotaxis protein